MMNRLFVRSIAFVTLAGTALVLTSGSETEDVASPQIQYHQALVQLAELEYDAALDSNRRVSGTFGKRYLERLQVNIRLSQRLLENAKRDAGEDMSTLHVLHAEEWARIADKDYRSALKARESNPQLISKYRVEKARLNAEITKLRVELWKEPKHISSLVDHMHWEIDRMSRNILDFQQRLERLE
jgi:hypothetical protein